MSRIINAIKNPKKIFEYLLSLPIAKILSDESYIKLMYRIKMGKKINLNNPTSFNEKLQWLKLYDRKDIYTEMVDKYEVKKLIADKIGEEYVIKTLGVWGRFEDIDFEKLPNQFVLKTTHDSGTVIICKDKSTFDVEGARKKINARLKYNYFYSCREWPYKNVKPRIIAEEFMQDRDFPVLNVFKVFNFNNGEQIVQAIQNDKTPHERIDYFDTKWKKLAFRQNYANSDMPLPKPATLEKMLEISKILSEGFAFLRTDFYEVNGNLYFSEFTFYSDAGLARFDPEEWDYTFGDWINLYK